MKIAPEFSRPIRVDMIAGSPRAIDAEASPADRAALAKRCGLVGIESLTAEAILSRRGEDVVADGSLTAEVTQSCVATGDPVRARLDEPFSIVFRTHPEGLGPDEEIELSESDCDVVFHDGAAIDLGSALADTLALALDPYPRCADADVALREAGVLSEEQAGPFAALAKLRGTTSPQ